MKKWIATQWIALAEVFGWPVPRRIRGLIVDEEFKALVAGEKRLTEALRAQTPPAHPVPAFLEMRIESALRREAPVAPRRPAWRSLVVPAAAMSLLLAF